MEGISVFHRSSAMRCFMLYAYRSLKTCLCDEIIRSLIISNTVYSLHKAVNIKKLKNGIYDRFAMYVLF